MDVAGAVKASKGGAVEFRVEKAGIVQGTVGKASFDDQAGREHQASSMRSPRLPTAKGNYIQRGHLLDDGSGREGGKSPALRRRNKQLNRS